MQAQAAECFNTEPIQSNSPRCRVRPRSARQSRRNEGCILPHRPPPPSQPAAVGGAEPVITVPLPWKSTGDFQSAFDLTAGLKRHLARRPERSYRLSKDGDPPVPPEQRRTRRLLTGSAPSTKSAGSWAASEPFLLTTDGGAHWTLISSPLSEDLGGIRATDALHATIWNARNTKSFETSDGGLTWNRVPHP